ncbi:MAG: hypothetical protein HFG53_15530 [Lachnospiraceae bacterium]|nr:hypothetical protein [Lachnospiraceae bacterium]
MRTRNTIYNVIAGLTSKLIICLCLFCVRKVMAESLDSNYIGLEGFFSNVIGLFSLVDLGFGTAIAYSLYDPIHKGETDKVNAIISLLKKVYIAVAFVIFLLSIAVSFSLGNYIKDIELEAVYIQKAFIIYAGSIAVTYLFAYQRTYIFALQKNYILSIIDSITKIVCSCIQVFLLSKFHSYLLYLFIVFMGNLITNYMAMAFLKRHNAFAVEITKYELPDEFKNRLKRDVKNLAITNLCWQGLVSTDNIIISMVVGVTDLAKNANYSAIIQAGTSIIKSILSGVNASFGDLLAEKKQEKIQMYFSHYIFISHYIGGLASVCFFYLSNQFVEAWVGKFYVFDIHICLILSLNLYLSIMHKTIGDIVNLTGLFYESKPYAIISLCLNIGGSLIFAKVIGVIGVFIGTTISFAFLIITMLKILTKTVVQIRKYVIIKKSFLYGIHMIVIFYILMFILNEFNFFDDLIVKFLMIMIFYNFFSVLFFVKSENLHFFIRLLRRFNKTIFTR